MMERPFRVHYLPSTGPSMLEVTVRFARPLPEAETLLNALRAPIEHFFHVGTLGGLAGETLHPLRSGLELLHHYPLGNDGFFWAFRQVRIHPGALLILENLFHTIHLKVASLRELLILSDMVPDGRRPMLELPFVYEPLPFDYSNESEDPTVRIEVELQEAQPDTKRKQLIDAWWRWFHLAMAGGFADETYLPGNNQLFPNDEPRSYPSELTFVLDDVAVSDQAFDSLVNMFHVLHHSVARIQAVTIM